jgi:hypothetical protein
MFVRWKRKRRKDQRTGEYRFTGEHREMDPAIVKRFPEYQGKSFSIRKPITREEWLLTASLVESVRINGQPRQRTIRYLGSIRECHLDLEGQSSIFHRGYFWRSVDTNLASLDLSDLERARIVAGLEDVVPRPDPEEIAQAHKRAEDRIAVLTAGMGRT